MHLLDTDTLTHLHAGHPRAVANLRALEDPEVGTTIVTKIEILRARYAFVLKASDGDQLLRAQRWLEQSEQLLAGLLIVPFDAVAANQFDKLVQTKKLKKIGRADLLIASKKASAQLAAPRGERSAIQSYAFWKSRSAHGSVMTV
jgi:tRNA(fMet)-specific endonuclease VapC